MNFYNVVKKVERVMKVVDIILLSYISMSINHTSYPFYKKLETEQELSIDERLKKIISKAQKELKEKKDAIEKLRSEGNLNEEDYKVEIHNIEAWERVIVKREYCEPMKNRELHCIGDHEQENKFCMEVKDTCDETHRTEIDDNLKKEIRKRCYNDSSCIGFPGYSLTTGYSELSILATRYIRDCTGIVIYHPQTKRGLMAHLLDDEEETSSKESYDYGIDRTIISKRDYIHFFKEEYFLDTPNNELEVHIAFGKDTSNYSIELVNKAVKEYFSEAKITSERITTKACHRGKLILDTKDGWLDISSYECNAEGGGSMYGFCFLGPNNTETD